ncbi:ankyrin repeat domain-containing protein [Cardinium endosymbiont of Nabis limbatus]|uniref:ankyrin repeat domain-containing protein n=1 Tax=Cardinium endosymbiont of Nabis limbatus TaxID=3066217 RepID=UPI003AF3BC1E
MHLTANKNASGVKCLINRGADVNAQDDEEDTALHLASRRGAVDIVNQLLNAKGINVNLKNKDKKTALDEARKDSNDYYHVKIIKLLEDSGAKSGKAVS